MWKNSLYVQTWKYDLYNQRDKYYWTDCTLYSVQQVVVDLHEDEIVTVDNVMETIEKNVSKQVVVNNIIVDS